MKLPASALFALSLLLGACAAPGVQPTISPAASAGTTPAATHAPTVSPTPIPTLVPPSVVSTATPAPTEGTIGAIPSGQLAGQGAPVTGWPGTYCWHNQCLDVPTIPSKDQLPMLTLPGPGVSLVFSLADGTKFVEWSILSLIDSNQANPDVLGEGGQGFDPDATNSYSPFPELTRVTVPSPRSGSWLVIANITSFEGQLQYAWHVVVQ